MHNATYYWRNYYNTSPCILQLVDNGTLDPPCVVEDGYVIGQGNTQNLFDDVEFLDNYGEFVNISSSSIQNNPAFTISGLKKSINPFKKHWYQIDFYKTRGYAYNPPFSYSCHTNMLGKLKPHVPNLNDQNPDYSYKILYLGHYKNNFRNDSSSVVDTLINDAINLPFTNCKENSNFTSGNSINLNYQNCQYISVYPNPNNGTFQILSSNEIISVTIINTTNEIIFENNNLFTKQFGIIGDKMSPGVYFVIIDTTQGICVKKIIVF